MKILKRITLYSATLILLAAGTLSPSSSAAPRPAQDNNPSEIKPRRHSRDATSKHQEANTEGRRHARRTIIFVGGRKGSQGAATKSNPTRKKKSNGALNPQPIPPGRQRQPK
ncbi:MAG: hypothetical protein ABI967_13750 [bacterium]